MTQYAIEFHQVSKHYKGPKGETKALTDLNLQIKAGEFFALLGPSGSGKTTSLRLLGGFEAPTSGRIKLFGAAAEHLPPFERPVATVFQDYALFNHLSVIDNVAYGMMVKGIDKATRYAASRKMLAMVQLQGLEDRKPGALSGGQRQRVSLARALLIEPKILLLDEPLSALDLKLREEMRVELKNLQKKLGINFVYVTHDQGEALAMADRVAIFNQGALQQVGTPRDIYEKPISRFVAEFVGRANLLPPALSQDLGLGRRWYALRGEKVEILTSGKKAANKLTLPATVVDSQYQGMAWHMELSIDHPAHRMGTQKMFSVICPVGDDIAKKGQQVTLAFAATAVHAVKE